MTNRNREFTLIYEKIKLIQCDVFFFLKDSLINKNYVVYTDNTFDKENKTKVYASAYIFENDAITLLPILKDEEYQFIENYISNVENEFGEVNDDFSQSFSILKSNELKNEELFGGLIDIDNA